jgi:membrane-bound lytic murein transglycosylase D
MSDRELHKYHQKTYLVPIKQQGDTAKIPDAHRDRNYYYDESNSYEEEVEENIWKYISDNIKTRFPNTRRYRRELGLYANNQDFFDRVSENAKVSLYHVVQEVEKRGMPLYIALLPMIESDYDYYAFSPAGAAGMWQLMPYTARMLGIRNDWWSDERFDVVASTDKALDYLEIQYRKFGDWKLALAAYNCGPGCVNKAIKRNKRRGWSTRFENLRLPKETKRYVPRILSVAEVIKHPEKYNIELNFIPNEPAFNILDSSTQISFLDLAKESKVELEELYRLNPAYKHWATHPDSSRNSYIMIPFGSDNKIARDIKQVEQKTNKAWVRYIARKKETVRSIAGKLKISQSSLIEVNDFDSVSSIQNKVIMIPVNVNRIAYYRKLFKKRERRISRLISTTKYRIKKGDSLWSIAHKKHIRLRELLKLNRHITVRSSIYPGGILRIAKKKYLKYISLQPDYNKEVIRKIHYRVESNETLSMVADKFEVPVSDIVQWNNRKLCCKRNKRIKKGQYLILNVDITNI